MCAQIGDSCHGVVYWKPSDITYSGSESASREVANDYTIAGSSPQTIDECLSGAEAPAKEDLFHLDYMQLSAAVSENPPVDPDWALVVTDSSAQAPEDYLVMPAKKWAEGSGKDTQLFHGPSGDGTAGFIPWPPTRCWQSASSSSSPRSANARACSASSPRCACWARRDRVSRPPLFGRYCFLT